MTPIYTDVRPSPIAGTWYPGSRARLISALDGYFAGADVAPVAGEVVGVMAPHAGYRYSGGVAAHAYRFVENMGFDTVVIIAPFHRGMLRAAPVFVTAHQAYRTPLGEVGVDHDAVNALRAAGVKVAPVRNDEEHALEIQLPFLQRALKPGFNLIPLMLGKQSQSVAEQVGHAVAKVVQGRRALLVASTDLSHFYDQATANRLDRVVLDRVATFDPAGVVAVEEQGKGFACGRGAVAAVMWAARDLGADAATVVSYATSGDTGGDLSRVVGYGAAVFYRHKIEA